MKQPVWDLPLRLFHWLLAALIGFSWWTAETHRDDLHFFSGYAVISLLIFRLLWGLVGGSTARFSAFVRGPAKVLKYVRGGFRWPAAGHAPLGALSVVAMLAMLLVQVSTGLVNSDEDGLAIGPLNHLVSPAAANLAHEVHEISFNILLGLMGLHIAAILFYRLVLGRDFIVPMITGKAELAPGVAPMRTARWWAALLCLVAAIAITRWIIAGAPPLGT